MKRTDTIKKIIMKRDNLPSSEANAVISDLMHDIKEAINTGNLEQIEDILADHVGLEPDYLDELLF